MVVASTLSAVLEPPNRMCRTCGSSRSGSGGVDNDERMATCPICDNVFDERTYQLIVAGVGAFDSVACADEARRRHRRRHREELMDGLLEAVERGQDRDGEGATREPAPPAAM